jgi:SAM-dependent methyltransferase
MDIWGRIYRDQWERDPHPHKVERNDGRQEEFESAAHYFEAPRLRAEDEELRRLSGPVLDIAAGPGSYAIYLQNHGLTVAAIDASPLAVKIAGMRGCLDARVMDLRALDLDPGGFGSIISMGNSFGAHQDPLSLPSYMTELRRLVRDDGILVTSTIDPLDTDDPGHLAYHERNRERGRPPGLLSVRVGYREEMTDWFHLWLTTREEVADLASAAGWELAHEAAEGPWRVRRFEAR